MPDLGNLELLLEFGRMVAVNLVVLVEHLELAVELFYGLFRSTEARLQVGNTLCSQRK